MDSTLMKVTQLPVIEEHLRSRKEQTEQRVAEAMSLVCTDETLTSVKNIRAEMNREFADAETQRKAIKAAIMEKYDSFEAVYRECIADPYKRADADLKAKIPYHQRRRQDAGNAAGLFSGAMRGQRDRLPFVRADRR